MSGTETPGEAASLWLGCSICCEGCRSYRRTV
jgi:hypothetical protein